MSGASENKGCISSMLLLVIVVVVACTRGISCLPSSPEDLEVDHTVAHALERL